MSSPTDRKYHPYNRLQNPRKYCTHPGCKNLARVTIPEEVDKCLYHSPSYRKAQSEE